MNVALVGASGRAGSCILKELVSRGHTVTGIARHPDKIADLPGVTRIGCDASQTDKLAQIATGHDVAISAVRFKDGDPDSLIAAMKKARIGRYLVVGGAGSLEVAPGQMLMNSPEFPEAAKHEAGKGAAFLQKLRAEPDLNWTFLSPAVRIVSGERTGKFRLGIDTPIYLPGGDSWISFEDYAIALVDELETPAHERRRFTVGY